MLQSLLPLPIPVWVLNLERSVDRRRFMKEQLERLGLHYESLRPSMVALFPGIT